MLIIISRTYTFIRKTHNLWSTGWGLHSTHGRSISTGHDPKSYGTGGGGGTIIGQEGIWVST